MSKEHSPPLCVLPKGQGGGSGEGPEGKFRTVAARLGLINEEMRKGLDLATRSPELKRIITAPMLAVAGEVHEKRTAEYNREDVAPP